MTPDMTMIREADAVPDEPPALRFEVTTAEKLREKLPERPPARIAGVLPGRGGALFIAQAGVGKTTLLANLARDLLEGTPFLGRQAVRQIGGRVALLSYEMDAAELIDWCASAGVDLARLVVVDLRDVPNPLRDVYERQALGEALDALEVEVVMVDTFGRAFTGDSQDSASEVANWFAMLNHFVRAVAGAHEWVVAAHAGWVDGRGRGSSALHDAPDAVLVYNRDKETDERTLRCDKLRGKDPLPRVTVEMDEGLRLSAGDPTDRYADRILEYVRLNPGCSGRAIRTAVTGNEHHINDALRRLLETGQVARERGPRNAWVHRVVPVVPSGADTSSGASGAVPLYRGTTHHTTPDGGE